MFVKEINIGYVSLKKTLETGNIFGIECKEKENSLCRLSNLIKEISSNQKVRKYMQTIGTNATTYITEKGSKLFVSIPRIILDFFIILFLTYYLFKDGKYFFFKVISLLPIKKTHQKSVIKTFNDVIYATVYGQIIVAVIQGAIGGIGFYIFNVGSPVLWTFVMIILSLLPYFGSAIIWLPASLYMFIIGISASNNSLLLRGIGLFFYGLLIISTIDNIIKPKIIGDKAKIHPAFIFIGAIGGIALFGISGILLGPLSIAVLIVFSRIYEKREFL